MEEDRVSLSPGLVAAGAVSLWFAIALPAAVADAPARASASAKIEVTGYGPLLLAAPDEPALAFFWRRTFFTRVQRVVFPITETPT